MLHFIQDNLRIYINQTQLFLLKSKPGTVAAIADEVRGCSTFRRDHRS